MLRPEHLVLHRQAALIERLRLRILALFVEEKGEIIQRQRHKVMLRPVGLLLDRQGAAEQGFGTSVVPLPSIERPEAVERRRHRGVLSA